MLKKVLQVFFLALIIVLFIGGFQSGYYIKTNFFNPISSSQKQINFLILGINGSTAADGDLTDTIIFASLNKESKNAALLSLPRDLWIPEIQAKINAAYHYGGLALARQTVESVLGQKIDYLLVLDFNAFEKAIDIVDGIEVEVKEGFDDYRYPIAGREKDLCGGDKELKCRYEHLRFEAGKQHMDGKTALKFVRSRNAEGSQGTDYARSQRQRQVIQAFRQKVLSKKVLSHPQKIFSLIEVFESATKTNIHQDQYGSFLLLALKINWESLKSEALTEDNFLVHPKSHPSKQWVLTPRTGNWEEIQGFTRQLVN